MPFRVSYIPEVIRLLKKEVKKFHTPYVTEISARRGTTSALGGRRGSDPFKVLISCILSLRTKDSETMKSSERLFLLAASAGRMAKLDVATIRKAIYPAGFYRRKAKTIKEISNVLVKKYSSKVPDTIEELITLKGVGRKTANLVVTKGYGKPGICVDTHVHRITNRWGLVGTKTPEETEFKLREILPGRYWIIFNDLLVAFGQNVCRPISPWCSKCVISKWCERTGVEMKR